MRVVKQAVHRGACEQRVTEELRELVDGAVRRDQRRAALIALPNDLVEVERLVARERPEPEVVDDEQVGRSEAEHPPVVTAVRASGAELLQHVVRGDVEDRVARSTRDGLVRVMLRPEQVRLVPWSEGTPTAQIVSASFEGPITVVRFTAGAATFTLKVPSADAPLQGRASIVLIGTGHVIPG